jgi:hypothetical protein
MLNVVVRRSDRGEKYDRLFAADTREMVEKLVERITSFEIIKQSLQGERILLNTLR